MVALESAEETKTETKRRRKKEKLTIMATEERKNKCCRNTGDGRYINSCLNDDVSTVRYDCIIDGEFEFELVSNPPDLRSFVAVQCLLR